MKLSSFFFRQEMSNMIPADCFFIFHYNFPVFRFQLKQWGKRDILPHIFASKNGNSDHFLQPAESGGKQKNF